MSKGKWKEISVQKSKVKKEITKKINLLAEKGEVDGTKAKLSGVMDDDGRINLFRGGGRLLVPPEGAKGGAASPGSDPAFNSGGAPVVGNKNREDNPGLISAALSFFNGVPDMILSSLDREQKYFWKPLTRREVRNLVDGTMNYSKKNTPPDQWAEMESSGWNLFGLYVLTLGGKLRKRPPKIDSGGK